MATAVIRPFLNFTFNFWNEKKFYPKKSCFKKAKTPEWIFLTSYPILKHLVIQRVWNTSVKRILLFPSLPPLEAQLWLSSTAVNTSIIHASALLCALCWIKFPSPSPGWGHPWSRISSTNSSSFLGRRGELITSFIPHELRCTVIQRGSQAYVLESGVFYSLYLLNQAFSCGLWLTLVSARARVPRR